MIALRPVTYLPGRRQRYVRLLIPLHDPEQRYSYTPIEREHNGQIGCLAGDWHELTVLRFADGTVAYAFE